MIKHVFEACRGILAPPEASPAVQGDLSVGCSIVSQQFDHMFYPSNT